MNQIIPRVRRTRPPTQNVQRADTGIRARTITLKVDRVEDSISRQIDPVDYLPSALAFTVIPTPYNVPKLFEIIENNSMLRPCIDAFVTNTVGTGWEIDPLARGKKPNEGENFELTTFLEHANSDESMVTVMSKVIDDRESVGFGFLEVIRDAGRNISLLRHAPAMVTRLGSKIADPLLVEYTISRGRRLSIVKEYRQFRRYVQIVGGRQVWFKELGDTRTMNRNTGHIEGEEGFQPGAPATEILHFKLPSNELYGVPRWINQLPSVIGSRESEEVNMRYFQDNTVPPMMLTVSGGRLTSNSYRELTRALHTNNIGADRQHKIMIVEAVGDGDSLDANGTPVRLNVEKLTDARQSDALFKDYDQANRDKIRMSWRLPGIVVGASNDTNVASAQIASFIADSQVFGPARSEIDEILNKRIVNADNGLSLLSCKLTSRVPAISSPETTLKTLTALNVIGAVTPRAAQQTANKVLQLELPAYPEKGEDGYEEWMDQPIQLSLKSTAKLNESDNENKHLQANQKTDDIDGTEESGNVGYQRVENGSEAEVLTA